MITALRSSLARNGTPVRLAVLALAIYTLLPAQLVWCSEGGAIPQLELAIDGQCLSGINNTCCIDTDATEVVRGLDDEQPAVLLLSDVHDHCTNCSDELVHIEHASLHAAVQLDLPQDNAGGCLYSVIPAAALLGASPMRDQVWQMARLGARTLNTLHTETTRLLI